jgi:membrane protein implicated in regulation of membrane protease activity
VKPTPWLAVAVVAGLAFLGGWFTVALVVFVLVPLWAVVTVVRWQASRLRERSSG